MKIRLNDKGASACCKPTGKILEARETTFNGKPGAQLVREDGGGGGILLPGEYDVITEYARVTCVERHKGWNGIYKVEALNDDGSIEIVHPKHGGGNINPFANKWDPIPADTPLIRCTRDFGAESGWKNGIFAVVNFRDNGDVSVIGPSGFEGLLLVGEFEVLQGAPAKFLPVFEVGGYFEVTDPVKAGWTGLRKAGDVRGPINEVMKDRLVVVDEGGYLLDGIKPAPAPAPVFKTGQQVSLLPGATYNGTKLGEAWYDNPAFIATAEDAADQNSVPKDGELAIRCKLGAVVSVPKEFVAPLREEAFEATPPEFNSRDLAEKWNREADEAASRPVNHGRIWSRYDRQRAIDAFKSGRSVETIGEELGRTPFAVVCKLTGARLIPEAVRDYFEENDEMPEIHAHRLECNVRFVGDPQEVGQAIRRAIEQVRGVLPFENVEIR